MGTLQLVKCLLVQMYACRLLIALYIYREEVGERDLDIPHTRPRCLVRLPEPFLFGQHSGIPLAASEVQQYYSWFVDMLMLEPHFEQGRDAS
jgi:hypothetical protein